jgi:anti-sigma factor RsiW
VDYPAGWTCERTARQFEAYVLSTLALLEALAVAEHLEACPGCTQSIVIYRATLGQARRG